MQNGSNIGADRIVFDWRMNRFPRLAIDLRIVIWSVPVSCAVAFHSSTALGLWMPLRPAKFWTAILCFSMLVSGCVYAEGIDTEHLFGFLIGTDVGNVGEREFQSQTTGRFSKSGDNYRAINQELELEFVPVDNFRIEVGGAFAAHDIKGTPGFEDRRQLAWQGISLDLRYRFLDRDTAPFGLTFAVEDHLSRIDESSGAVVRNYGAGGFIDAAEMVLDSECQAKGRRISIQKPVAQIKGNTLPGQLASILKTGCALNVMGREGASDLDPEIVDRHELQFEFLVDRSIVIATFGKSSGRLALEFALADVANVSADQEAK